MITTTSQNNDCSSLQLCGHNKYLDGFRAIAVLLVMLTHTTYYYTRLFPETLWERVYLTFVMVGWSGVDLFFVLSGFLITGILLDSKSKPNYFRNFYIRRTLRIFPIYYLLVGVSLFMGPRYPFPMPEMHIFTGYVPLWEKLYYIFYLTNFLELYNSRNVVWLLHCWSLAIEEQFYLVWPLIVYYSGRKTIVGICIILILSANMFRLQYTLEDHEANTWLIYHLTHTRWDTLAYGALLAIASKNKEWSNFLIRWAPHVLIVFFVAIFIQLHLEISSFPAGKRGIPQHSMIIPFWHQITLYTGFAVIYSSMLIVVLTCNNTILRMFFGNPIMVWIGKHSYGLYIWHWPVLWFSYNYIPHPYTFWDNFKTQIIVVPISFLLAFLSMEIIEKPFLKLKERFTSK